ncbi:microphthalmia-associated transcription factor-like [Tachypleus tridentatus]|uniref:microphthalmia-associated transcription factor-like n=1 Tax=Tachypleus tridentatus TaxID=6853 RepID=UPI003FD2FD51
MTSSTNESGIDLDYDLNDHQRFDLESQVASPNIDYFIRSTESSSTATSANVNTSTNSVFYTLKSRTPPETHIQSSGDLKTTAIMSRTNLKQQLMREQMQQLKQKEALVQPKILSSSAPTTAAIKVPVGTSAVGFSVPRQVLQVQTCLENPTKYHVLQSQRRQVQQYISNTHGSMHPQIHTLSVAPNVRSCDLSPDSPSPILPNSSAPTSILDKIDKSGSLSLFGCSMGQDIIGIEGKKKVKTIADEQRKKTHCRNKWCQFLLTIIDVKRFVFRIFKVHFVVLLSVWNIFLQPTFTVSYYCKMKLPTPSCTSSSGKKLDEFWDDFSNLGTGVLEGDPNFLELKPCLNMPSKMTGAENLLDLFSVGQAKSPASCSSDLTSVKEEPLSLSDDQIQALAKERQKKDNHNMIERRRRFNINDRIKELGTLYLRTMTRDHFDLVRDLRQNKGTILKASVDYVRCLKKEVSKIPHMEERQRQLEHQNRKLLLRIQELKIQLHSHGIQVTDTIWKSSQETDLNSFIKQEPIPPNMLLNNPGTSNTYTNGSMHVSTLDLDLLELNANQEPHISPVPSPSSGLSSAHSASPGNPLGHYDDMMMDDHMLPVNDDPFLSSHHVGEEAFSSDHIEFLQ